MDTYVVVETRKDDNELSDLYGPFLSNSLANDWIDKTEAELEKEEKSDEVEFEVWAVTDPKDV